MLYLGAVESLTLTKLLSYMLPEPTSLQRALQGHREHGNRAPNSLAYPIG